MENFKILRNGQYDHKANIQLKIRNAWPPIENKITDFFEKH